jgi:MarR family 2-MHQ and catechol resistance regulon transcriptional repressor
MRGRNNEANALNTCVKLMGTAESLTARVHKHLTAVGLTISQFGVREALYQLRPLSRRDIG